MGYCTENNNCHGVKDVNYALFEWIKLNWLHEFTHEYPHTKTHWLLEVSTFQKFLYVK